MKIFQRIVSLVVLAGFLGLSGAQFSHTHKELAAKPEAECGVCKITHQSPALLPQTTVLTPASDLVFDVSLLGQSPSLLICRTSHGLSPPALS